MALVQRNLFKVNSVLAKCNFRSFSSEKNIKKSVFISQSKDIYTNLALEKWLYRNFNFENHHVLMLSQNEPSVVIGEEQNPWLETNIADLAHITDKEVKLARRSTGGGTVYQDEGNLNLTFFTGRQNHNSKYNLQLITRGLFREYGLKVDISPQENLILRNSKVADASAKLGDSSAYHHCTLLVNSNKLSQSQALQQQDGIQTSAPRSTTRRVHNLVESNPKVEMTNLYKALGWEFLRTAPLTIKDLGLEFANTQKGFHMINPTESWFNGISEIRDELKSWEWRFGETPEFSVSRSFAIPDHLAGSDLMPEDLKVTMVVENGRVSDVSLYVPPGLSANGFSGNVDVKTGLVGQKFSEEAFANLEWSIGALVNEKDKFVRDCVRQVMTSV